MPSSLLSVGIPSRGVKRQSLHLMSNLRIRAPLHSLPLPIDLIVAVRDPHSPARSGHATVTLLPINRHPIMALAFLRCASAVVSPRPLRNAALLSYAPQSAVTCHLSWNDVSYHYQIGVFWILQMLAWAYFQMS
jgi:hypothetical protein